MSAMGAFFRVGLAIVFRYASPEDTGLAIHGLAGDDGISYDTGMFIVRHVLDNIFNNLCQVAKDIIVGIIRIILHERLEVSTVLLLSLRFPPVRIF
jgi:hypothetical protein